MSEGELERLAGEAWQLTDVAKEGLRTELAHRNLQFELREAPADERIPNLVTVRQFTNVSDALLAKGVLDSAGVEAFLADENIVRVDWFYSNLVGGVKVQVKEEDVDAANEVLGQKPPEEFEVEGVGNFVQPRCPECGSLDVSFEELIKPVAYGSIAGMWLAGVVPPIPLKRIGWKCHACGHAWDEPSDQGEANASPES